jgi:hypothetical protein
MATTDPAGRVFCAEYHIVFIYGIGTLCVMGFILNAFNLLIFKRIDHGSSAGIFLLRILAVSDLAFLSASFLYFTVRHIVGEIRIGSLVNYISDLQVEPVIFYATYTPYYITMQTRNLLILLIAIDR